jgi:hypothetical protein
MTDGPLIVQSDKTLLLDIDHPMSVECRRAIAPFAELERSPEHIHTYRLTPLGLWNARAAGHDAEQVIDTLIKIFTVCRSTFNSHRCGRDDVALWSLTSRDGSGSWIDFGDNRYCCTRRSNSR